MTSVMTLVAFLILRKLRDTVVVVGALSTVEVWFEDVVIVAVVSLIHPRGFE